MKYTTATPYIASYVLARRDNKIVFVLRENTGWMDGYYGLPSGKVEKGETYSQAAVREAKEEIDIEIKSEHLKFTHLSHRKAEDAWVDVYFEAVSWQGEPINAEPGVHKEIAWLAVDNLPDNVVPAVRFVLEQIKAGNTYSEYDWH